LAHNVNEQDSHAAIEQSMRRAATDATAVKADLAHLGAQRLQAQAGGDVDLSSSVGRNQEASVYGGMVMEGLGLGAVGAVVDAVTTGFDTVKPKNGAQSIDKMARSIRTEPLSARGELLFKAKTSGESVKNSDVNTDKIAQIDVLTGTLLAQLKQVQNVLGMGHQAKMVKGHQIYHGLQPGAGGFSAGASARHLALNDYQPKPPKDISEEGGLA